jgi:Rod binding domain-containing protein
MRKAAADLHGVFVQALYKTMRDSVDNTGGLVERSQGEEIFAGLMDERLAADTGTRWHRGLGDAIYRALRQKAGLESPSVPAAPVTSALPPRPRAAPAAPPSASPVRIP